MDDVPVVLVHGFASSFERNWQETGWADLLRDEGRSVIGVDLLGHGKAAKPEDPAAYVGLEQSIAAAMPAAGPADAVGFSMGAQLLLRLASASPGRFRRIVLGGIGDGVFARTDPEPVARAVETGQAAPDAGPSAAALAYFAATPGNDPAALAACLRGQRTPLTEADVAAIEVPVLLVLGDRDFAGPADRLAAALPDARLLVLPGTDHFGTPKDFRFVQAALGFVR
ncbi:MAG TPA: alpha/beta hydrolase [Streptosporangiaceae bacterium]|nr:alpha/beta hydrolase [Streptosporangiaceae bacterium]